MTATPAIPTGPPPGPPSAWTPGRVMVNTAAVLAVLAGAWLLWQARSILLVLILGIILATAIEPLVYRLRKKGLSRGQSIMAVYVGIFAVLGLGFYLVFPPLVRQTGQLITDIPNILDNLEKQARASDNEFLKTTGERTLDRAGKVWNDFAETPPLEATTALGLVTTVLGFLFTTVTVMIVAFYWMTEKAIIKRVVLGLFPLQHRDRAHGMWDTIEAKIGGWTRGQLLLCVVIGTLSAVAYSRLALDLRFWVALAIWAGVTELIPFIGPFLGGGAATIIALTESWQKALIVVGFVIVLQQLEGAVLVPRVMRNAVGLTPLTVVLAVLVGGVLAGPIGSVLAIPVAAAIQVLIQDLLHSRDDDAEGPQADAAIAALAASMAAPLPPRPAASSVSAGPLPPTPSPELGGGGAFRRGEVAGGDGVGGRPA